jgi:SAM-dependent methyltransferase
MNKDQRLTFGEDALLYDRVRPSYPPELIDDVVSLVGKPARALDAGCGTGKATVMLAERGLIGVGVEPDADMAALAAKHLEGLPEWRVDVNDFERWEPRAKDLPFDLVTAAQAWHWADRDQATKQAERLLRKGGWLAIFGHRPNPPDTPLRREIDAIYDELAPEPSAVSKAPKERVTPGSAFGSPIECEYPGWQDYSAANWIAVERTSSDKKILSPERREQLLARIEEAINRHGGTYRHHFIVRLWASERL